jgi:SAM-dependent methyltransferase
MGELRKGDGDLSYMLPHHPAEVDRLDVQHYALLETLGRNFLAPVRRPDRILDVGAGSGQWGFDLAQQFPRALVVGLDVVPGKAGAPENYRTVRANLLRGLPFKDDRFDFTHQRLMAASAIPRGEWPRVVADLVRVTAPGGWIELAEVLVGLEPAGAATRRLFDMTRRVGRTFGVDMEGVVVRALGEHLARAGLVDVEQRPIAVPVGEWGGRPGSLAATDMRALHLRLAPAYEKQLGVSTAELNELLKTMQEEWERHHSQGTFIVAYGRRPT